MDFQELNHALDYMISHGVTFSTEQKIALQASLGLLQKDNKFEKVYFWGKIYGSENDYMVAYGIGKDYMKKRTFFYSMNWGLEWILLPTPMPITIDQGLSCKGLFTGDPTADSKTEFIPENRTEISEGENWMTVKEEERLFAIVHDITNSTQIVPRGFLFMDPTGLVMLNKTFEGLSKTEGSQFHSYYHVRPPQNDRDKNIVSRGDYNIALDFLDSIANDLPLGCWSIQIDKNEKLASIRSLYWPGSVGYHCLRTNKFGWVYFGNGIKNNNLPFMMSKPIPFAVSSIPENAEELDAGGDAGGVPSTTISNTASSAPTMDENIRSSTLDNEYDENETSYQSES